MPAQSRARSRQDRAHAGNMKPVRQLSFKCTECGSVANTLYLLHNRGEVDAFLAGKPEW